jgi:hypothetical protein
MIRYFLCRIIGTGISGDTYRPSLLISSIIDGIEIFKYPYLQWCATYYPNNPPYEFCLVRIEFEDDNQIVENEDIEKEIITDSDWEEIKKYNFIRERFI